MPEVLRALADKDASVKAAAEAAGASIMNGLNPAAIKVAVPALLEVLLDAKSKPQTRMGALYHLNALADSNTEEVSYCLPEIVPAVTESMTDIKKDLATLATETLVKCCGAVGNKDIEPFIPNLVRCIAQPAEVQDCVHKLAATTFVQAVDAKTLALLVPLLLRGLQERSTPIRRKSCVIIDNMAKLVDSPVDALEFSNLLTPYVEKAVKEMSNPEARTMAERASKTLAQTAADADAPYDLVFIDGRARAAAVARAFELLSPGGVVVLPDANRVVYLQATQRYPNQVVFRDRRRVRRACWQPTRRWTMKPSIRWSLSQTTG